MHISNQPESIQNLIHKKEPKKLKAKGLLPIGQKDYRTIGLGYHSRQEANQQMAGEQMDKSEAKVLRTRTQLKNFEIDQYLYLLINEGMIDENYIPFYAKACHTLGIPTVNRLKINAVNGQYKQKLFAYKVKGALQLHFKQEFEREP